MNPDPLQMNANATHQCILAGIVSQTTGPVLELGVGYYSTPILHFMCQNRPLLSVESHLAWHEFFAIPFRNGMHDFYFARTGLPSEIFEVDKYKDLKWDVAFVDHSPSNDRVKCVEALRSKAKYIVCHDTEPGAVVYEWNGIFDTFKYKMYWDFFKNGTTIVSDVAEIGLV